MLANKAKEKKSTEIEWAFYWSVRASFVGDFYGYQSISVTAGPLLQDLFPVKSSLWRLLTNLAVLSTDKSINTNRYQTNQYKKSDFFKKCLEMAWILRKMFENSTNGRISAKKYIKDVVFVRNCMTNPNSPWEIDKSPIRSKNFLWNQTRNCFEIGSVNFVENHLPKWIKKWQKIDK